jgi:hypothetical protein
MTHETVRPLRIPIWPVVLAPMVAGIYYIALRDGFASSMGSIVSDASDVDPGDWGMPTWGSHWFYRAFAEPISVAFATFVAAGIARGRERMAAIVGGLGISLFYFTKNAGLIYLIYFSGSPGKESIEPWYQHLIEAGIILAAPIIGATVSRFAIALNQTSLTGFAGINRLHFLWLWLAASAYANGLISPLANMWLHTPSNNRFSDLAVTIFFGLPALVFVISIAWGLATLAAKNGAKWSARVNNVVGPVILIVGWMIAMAIKFSLEKLVGWAV